jgi:hypothetical protein
MSAIMGDYVAGFLGGSEGCNWNMNAFDVRLGFLSLRMVVVIH